MVGVTGGHDQGGLIPDISYATYLDRRFEPLLQQAERT